MGQSKEPDTRPASTTNTPTSGSKRRKISHPQPGSHTQVHRRVQGKGTTSRGKRRGSHPPREIRQQNGLTKSGSDASTLRETSNGESKFPLSFAKSILDKIWIRNKNQHRTQPWWKSLSMLRKAVSQLVLVEQEDLFLQGLIGEGRMDAKVVRERFERETQLRREKEIWVDWIRQVLVPKAYLGFSGLVSDTQFANLGVVLIGVLADVASTVGVPTPSRQEGAEEGGMEITPTRRVRTERGTVKARSLMGTSIRVTGLQSGEVVERTYDSDDLGEVVERKGSDLKEEQAGTSPRPDRNPDRNPAPTAKGDQAVAADAATDGVVGKNKAASVRVIEERRRENPASRTERSTTNSPSSFLATLQRDPTATSQDSDGAHAPSPPPRVPEPTENLILKDEPRPSTGTAGTATGKKNSQNDDESRPTPRPNSNKVKRKRKGKNAIDDLFAGLA
ncbi:uncharacterized protein Z519_02466 [Cladophialophora bantiana CBS 173.52]|uniref:RNase MRP protein 1 RNA binding domain-containing protein n=1 Tax=Cladophialophora bantiana (strain ATCC 10958 / CBS 173.52 / CDC B-1940 / NIH 8579) TaxID=1442370 RepID=A0A0D2IJW8_CLAB1|nr:uncharacterized protein Z519_02466 [Cladophialophora bantiana CBS 173.52]KIW97074.1 hypothetical protein Z519_02466 [Cladophialophora bantiana CBS 173.52]